MHGNCLVSEDYLKGWSYTYEIDRLEIVMKEKQDRQRRFDKLIEDHLIIDERPMTQLIEGRAQDKIPLYIEYHDIDLIVMGTVCRTGIAGYFIGNTAESILSEVSCSVLTLKPDGFISPVKSRTFNSERYVVVLFY
jgi:nucleotide-binding universal stress UspA family protein